MFVAADVLGHVSRYDGGVLVASLKGDTLTVELNNYLGLT